MVIGYGLKTIHGFWEGEVKNCLIVILTVHESLLS